MINVENKYDFTVKELTDILKETPIDCSSDEEIAKYIVQALNINRIIKEHTGEENVFEDPVISRKAVVEINRTENRGAPYHIIVTKNRDNSKIFESDARFIAFYAYDPLSGRPHKGVVSEVKPKPTDIVNICELLGATNDWGTFQ